jgi:hypothetical protein
MQDKALTEMARKEAQEIYPAIATDAASKNALKELTRRAVGLNMIMGLGGLHGARGLTDRFWGSPEARPLATPVASTTLPPGLVGTWVYHNQAQAIETIVEQLQFVIGSDGSGSIIFQRRTTEFQTGCMQNFIASWPNGNWTFVNVISWTGVAPEAQFSRIVAVRGITAG